MSKIRIWTCRVLGFFLALIVLYFYWATTSWIGFLFGRTFGASETPIAHVVAPLVFGLLATIGIGVVPILVWRKGVEVTLKNLPSFDTLDKDAKQNLLRECGIPWYWVLGYAVILLVGVNTFCRFCDVGLATGIRDRLEPCPSVATIVGDTSVDVDPQLAEAVYRLQWKLRQAGMHRLDRQRYLEDVVQPLLADREMSGEEKRRVLDEIIEKTT